MSLWAGTDAAASDPHDPVGPITTVTAPAETTQVGNSVNGPHSAAEGADNGAASSPSEPGDELPDLTAFEAAAEADVRAAQLPFREWRAALDEQVRVAASALLEAFQAAQARAEADAVFVRGEAAWRKHMAALSDRVDEAVHRELEALTTQVARHADAASEVLTESLGRSQQAAKRALAAQRDMYQDKLRRARGALKKEMARFATLEACLRTEQARQREALHEQQVQQLTEAHRDREAHLHATLRDLRSAYTNVETANEQLLEALRASRREAEQLKNSLLSMRTSGSRGSSSGSRRGATPGSGPASASASPTRGSADAVGASVLKGMALTTSELVEQNLRQQLETAGKDVASAKQQIAELEREQRASDKREQQAREQAAKLQAELSRATGLLAEAREELVTGRERTAELERERGEWREAQLELQFRLDASARRVDDLTRVDEAARAYAAELERRQQLAEARDARVQALEDALAEWQALCGAGSGSGYDLLERAVTAFLGDSPASCGLYDSRRAALEAKLRLEMEKRFGDQLGLRVAHERTRVLARLETLCGREQPDEGTSADLLALLASPSRPGTAGVRQRRLRSKKHGGSAADAGRAAFLLLSRVVRQAYEDLGVCVGAWSETDLDALAAKVHELKNEVTARDAQLSEASTRLELQRLALARCELLQSEKEALIAELTGRCRQLRTALEEASAQQQGDIVADSPGPLPQRRPLTIYGVPQPMEAKQRRRARSLTAQTRPASAAPALAALVTAPTSKVPMASRLGEHGRWLDAGREEDGEREAWEAPEHVRSVLKSQLMQAEASNQQDGGPRSRAAPPLGSEGVLEILQRRRQRA